MEPPFVKKITEQQISSPLASHSLAMSLNNVLAFKKIRKKGPFKLPGFTPGYNAFSQVLAELIRSIPELPDFSGDKKIAVMSDYGGEHDRASYRTYSFLFLSMDKIGPFEKKMEELRQNYDIFDPYSEFKYKDLRYGPRARALPAFLDLVDKYIHGAIVTVAIDKKIGSVFGVSAREAHGTIVRQLDEGGFGKWPDKVAEKAMRVLHILAAFTAAMTYDNQRFLWYSDLDQINEDAEERSFSDIQKIFGHVCSMYMTHHFEIYGFGKSFNKKSYLDDLLSVADFSAGILQDILVGDDTKMDIPGGDEKLKILKWYATPAKFLSKIHIRLSSNGDGTYEGNVLSLKQKW